MSEKGLDATISEIASAAGVSDSIIYHYFKHKEDLMFSVVGDNIREYLDKLENELQGIREPLSQLSKHIWFLLKRIDKEADHAQISLFQCRSRYSYYEHPAYTVHARRSFRLFYRIMKEGIDRGDFSQDIKIAIVLNMFHGLVDMENVTLRLDGDSNRAADDFEGIMDLVEPILAPQTNDRKAKSDKIKRILQAAEKVFGEKGYHQSAIQDVAQEANLAEGSIYWYFKNKEELLYSSFIDGLQRSADDFEAASSQIELSSSEGDPEQLVELEKFLRNFYLIAVKHPAFSKVFVMNGIFNRQFYGSRAYEPFKNFINRIMAMLDDGKSKGLIRLEVNNRIFQNLVLGTFCHSVGRWHVTENDSWHNILYDIDLIVSYLLRAVVVKKKGKGKKHRKMK